MKCLHVGLEATSYHYTYTVTSMEETIPDESAIFRLTGDFSGLIPYYIAQRTSLRFAFDGKLYQGVVISMNEEGAEFTGWASDYPYPDVFYAWVSIGHAYSCWNVLKTYAAADPLIDESDIFVSHGISMTYNNEDQLGWYRKFGFRVITRSSTTLVDTWNDRFADSIKLGYIPTGSGYVIAHYENEHNYKTTTTRLDVISAVGAGDSTGSTKSYGPGLEYYSSNSTAESYTTPAVGGTIARILVNNPTWHFDDARQALRQTAANWETGWSIETFASASVVDGYDKGGFGAVNHSAARAVTNEELGIMSPIIFESSSVTNTINIEWRNPRQAEYSQSVFSIFFTEPSRDSVPSDGKIIYQGTGSSFEYTNLTANDSAWVVCYCQKNNGEYSQVESYDIKYYDNIIGFSLPKQALTNTINDDSLTHIINDNSITHTITNDSLESTIRGSNIKLIYTLEDLQNINNDLTSSYMLMNDIDASETATWNDGAGFVPIGTNATKFIGDFYGNDHTITNLYINRLGIDFVGLFGYTDEYGLITNLHLVNPIVIANGGSIGSLGGSIGGHTTVKYCTTTGGSVTGNWNVGGLIGEIGAYVNVYYSSNNTKAIGVEHVGGVIGDCCGTLYDSWNSAEISGSDTNIGGVIGMQSGYSYRTYSYGVVSGSANTGGNVGLAARIPIDCYWDIETSGIVTGSYATGKTTAEMKQQATFTNWDFDTIWEIEENVSYPTLR